MSLHPEGLLLSASVRAKEEIPFRRSCRTLSLLLIQPRSSKFTPVQRCTLIVENTRRATARIRAPRSGRCSERGPLLGCFEGISPRVPMDTMQTVGHHTLRKRRGYAGVRRREYLIQRGSKGSDGLGLSQGWSWHTERIVIWCTTLSGMEVGSGRTLPRPVQRRPTGWMKSRVYPWRGEIVCKGRSDRIHSTGVRRQIYRRERNEERLGDVLNVAYQGIEREEVRILHPLYKQIVREELLPVPFVHTIS